MASAMKLSAMACVSTIAAVQVGSNRAQVQKEKPDNFITRGANYLWEAATVGKREAFQKKINKKCDPKADGYKHYLDYKMTAVVGADELETMYTENMNAKSAKRWKDWHVNVQDQVDKTACDAFENEENFGFEKDLKAYRSSITQLWTEFKECQLSKHAHRIDRQQLSWDTMDGMDHIGSLFKNVCEATYLRSEQLRDERLYFLANVVGKHPKSDKYSIDAWIRNVNLWCKLGRATEKELLQILPEMEPRMIRRMSNGKEVEEVEMVSGLTLYL